MRTAKTLAGVCYAALSMTLFTAMWLALSGCSTMSDPGGAVDFGPLCNPIPPPAGCTLNPDAMMMPPGDGMMPPGDGMPGPKECLNDSDCTSTCPMAAKGCKCATNPMSATGKSCAPACTTTTDCPMPMGMAMICDTMKGICIRP